jgi:hypothetical protein
MPIKKVLSPNSDRVISSKAGVNPEREGMGLGENLGKNQHHLIID